jgi:hypothetical protein
MVPLTAPFLGVHFFWAYFPQKLTPKRNIETEYKLFQRHVSSCLIIIKKEGRLLCMGHTSTANKPFALYYCPNQLSFSWESNTARAKASKFFKYLL